MHGTGVGFGNKFVECMEKVSQMQTRRHVFSLMDGGGSARLGALEKYTGSCLFRCICALCVEQCVNKRDSRGRHGKHFQDLFRLENWVPVETPNTKCLMPGQLPPFIFPFESRA